MRAQGEMLRGEMESQESRQRAAIDELVEAIDVRTQVAELGEDVRWEYQERAESITCRKSGGNIKIQILSKKIRSLQDPPVCYVCAYQHLWREVALSSKII